MEERGTDRIIQARIAFARQALRDNGRLSGRRTQRVSARLDPGLIKAAKERSGIKGETALLEAALALIAEPDGFWAWMMQQRGKLDEDFELGI